MRYFPVARRPIPATPTAHAQAFGLANQVDSRKRVILTLLAAVAIGGGLFRLAVDDTVVETAAAPDEPTAPPATSHGEVDPLDAALAAALIR
jgi:hypothetical protein